MALSSPRWPLSWSRVRLNLKLGFGEGIQKRKKEKGEGSHELPPDPFFLSMIRQQNKGQKLKTNPTVGFLLVSLLWSKLGFLSSFLHVFWEIKKRKREYLEAWSSVAVACWHTATCRLARFLRSLASFDAVSWLACLLPVLLCHGWHKLSILYACFLDWLAVMSVCDVGLLFAILLVCCDLCLLSVNVRLLPEKESKRKYKGSVGFWYLVSEREERLCLWQALCRF